MSVNNKQNNTKEVNLYNNILLLSRNKIFYTNFNLADTFQNRINLIFLHFSFLMIKINKDNRKNSYKIFYQKLFDLIFNRIEENMREIGFGDVNVNKNMKSLVKNFYNILLETENYYKKNINSKKTFFNKYLVPNSSKIHSFESNLVNYFDKYEAFCFDLKSDSVLKGDLFFNFK